MISDRTAKILFEIGAVRVAEGRNYFKYSAKPLQGPIYVDCRMIVSHDLIKQEIAEFMKELVGPCDVVLGSTTAGMSPAENLSRVLGPETMYLYVRTDAKEYGLGQRIEGDKPALLRKAKHQGYLDFVDAEDLINSGRSSKIVNTAFKKWCESNDISIRKKKITAIVSYGNKTFEQWAAEEGFELGILVYLPYVFEFGMKNGMISKKQCSSAIEFLSDSKSWREQRGLAVNPL